MKSQPHRHEPIEVPMWLNSACDHNRVVSLSDTRTYRLLATVYQGLVANSILASRPKGSFEDDLHTFTAWFLRLGCSTPAYIGLTWLYLEVGKKVISGKAIAAEDHRLSDILLTFVALTDEGGADDQSAERYHEMIGDGWPTFKTDDVKESLYQGLKAAFTTQAYSELVALGKASNLSESRTQKTLRFLAKKSRASSNHGARF